MENKIIIPAFANFFRKKLELFFWVLAIILLYSMDEQANSLCLFQFIGIEQCLGCGIGHSIHAGLHGRFADAIFYHPLGLIAILTIFIRLFQLINHQIHLNEHKNRLLNPIR